MDNQGKGWPDAETFSFIVKIWVEQAHSKTESATWQGHMTHVPSGERHYLKNLDDIPVLIAQYLGKLGVKSKLGQRVRRWLKRLIP